MCKESLKKCDGQYLSLEMNRIEVVLDDSGRPALHRRSAEDGQQYASAGRGKSDALGTLAAAVVVKLNAAAAAVKLCEAGTAQDDRFPAVRCSAPQGWWKRLFG